MKINLGFEQLLNKKLVGKTESVYCNETDTHYDIEIIRVELNEEIDIIDFNIPVMIIGKEVNNEDRIITCQPISIALDCYMHYVELHVYEIVDRQEQW